MAPAGWVRAGAPPAELARTRAAAAAAAGKTIGTYAAAIVMSSLLWPAVLAGPALLARPLGRALRPVASAIKRATQK